MRLLNIIWARICANPYGSKYCNWQYKNTGLLAVSIVFFILLTDTPAVQATIHGFGAMGYFGAFIAGIFFVSTFTVVPAGYVLYHIAQDLNPFLIAIVAGLGGVIGDLVMFKFLKDRVFAEVAPLFSKLGNSNLRRLFHTPYFAWLAPVLGAAIIASPFPDELGISLLGLSKVRTWQFVILTTVLDILGVFLIVLAARSF